MVDVINYDFKPLTDKIAKLEEYFINTYVDKFLKSEGAISLVRIMRILIVAKY